MGFVGLIGRIVVLCCSIGAEFVCTAKACVGFELCGLEKFQSIICVQEEFEEYAEKAKTLPENTTNENKLILYGLFKQATVGNVNTSRPGIFNMRDRAKWDAWKAVEGKSQEEAMSDYITKVKQLLEEACASS
ncbi:UNVERIFIED_CONTAM: Acyl-CoA-binding protein [Sesamum angustifolium]|uniref:Acyl-CoA-binding protein n=1 Tax=Sesamum angustifolium TaxID=2727405 RepID=A0AAW2MBC6_9LAMI